MYLLIDVAYQQIERHIPPLVPFSTINSISISIERSTFNLVIFKAFLPCSNLYILEHIFLKFSNTSANNNVSL